ncbi:LysE/ArgO family amino acid transporter [Corynebacterium uterequi]|uniref:Lysine efflux permease n=1 Tax=Corynebacterium uterequi TaxID=1072256 RepID=A0A0G3HC15_9CORY|nr:LysE family transporter [Corynebacterium uterequi]AKK10936.1 lysine efflux permease [Corynebacterium uterequi]
MKVLLAGLMLGASLIVAIGPQNLMVINYGIRRRSVGIIVITCILGDVVLYVAGTLGVSGLVLAFPWALEVLRWLGVFFLLALAAQSVREALWPKSAALDAAQELRDAARGWVGPVRTILAVTFLNPAAFLDTLVIAGSIANQYPLPQRWYFLIGAMIASALWFPLLGYGAAALSGPLSKPSVWRVLKGVIAVMLLVLAVRVALM